MLLIKEIVINNIWSENVYSFINIENNLFYSGLVIRMRNNILVAKYYTNEKGMYYFFMSKNRKYKL